MCPPLWFENGWFTNSSSRAVPSRAFRPSERNSTTRVSPLDVRVVDVEAAVLRVARVERHRQQALLGAVGADAAADVEEEPPLPLLEHEDAAGLLDDVDARGLGRRRGDVHGLRRTRGRPGRCSAAGAPCLPRRPPGATTSSSAERASVRASAWRSSSSRPGWSRPSTWSPLSSTSSPSSEVSLAVSHDGDQPSAVGQLHAGERLAEARRARIDLHLDDLEVLLAQLEEMDEPVLGHLVLRRARAGSTWRRPSGRCRAGRSAPGFADR